MLSEVLLKVIKKVYSKLWTRRKILNLTWGWRSKTNQVEISEKGNLASSSLHVLLPQNGWIYRWTTLEWICISNHFVVPYFMRKPGHYIIHKTNQCLFLVAQGLFHWMHVFYQHRKLVVRNICKLSYSVVIYTHFIVWVSALLEFVVCNDDVLQLSPPLPLLFLLYV